MGFTLQGNTPENYIESIAQREIAWITRYADAAKPSLRVLVKIYLTENSCVSL